MLCHVSSSSPWTIQAGQSHGPVGQTGKPAGIRECEETLSDCLFVLVGGQGAGVQKRSGDGLGLASAVE